MSIYLRDDVSIPVYPPLPFHIWFRSGRVELRECLSVLCAGLGEADDGL